MATLAEAMAAAASQHQAGNLQEAAAICQQIVAAVPRCFSAWHLLGLIALQARRSDLATAHFSRALELMPDSAEAHNDLATALFDLGRLPEVVHHYRRSVELRPDFLVAWFNLGNALQSQRELQAAVDCYRRALELQPEFAEACSNLGNTLADSGQLVEAADCYRRAIGLKPELAEAHNGLGLILVEQGMLDDGMACYRRALELRPTYAEAHSNLGVALKNLGRLDESITHHRRTVDLRPESALDQSPLLFTLQFHPAYDAAAICEEHRRWNERHAERFAGFARPHANSRASERRLKIGYVSPDFRNHSQAFFTVPLFSAHDHLNFEIVCYSNSTRADSITGKLRSLADAWRDIAGMSEDTVAEMIRQDQIDILVDLTMHMDRNRLLVFARKPAPVQVTWLAYPGTTGLETIDYRLTDPQLDPPGLFDSFYSEKSYRLPDTFWCYDPLSKEPGISELPALASSQITFGCLNNFCKLNDGVLQLWARVMKAVSNSRLVVLVPQGSARERTLEALEQEDISRDRVVFADFRPRVQYLAQYHHIDIGLDTFPYNGHTTSLDSYWMGVPVITLVGKTVVARAGVSQLTNLGLNEFIAQTPEQYVQIAAELAGNLTRLSELRSSLRDRMKKSPLMDAPRFARNIEAAYREMWRRWCGGGGPDAGLQIPA